MNKSLIILGVVMLVVAVQIDGRRRRWRGRQESSSDTCSQPAETGRCRAYLERWYFDPANSECKTFVYGGCGGNSNNFLSKIDCENRCIAGSNSTSRSSDQCPPQVSCLLECPEGFLKDRRGCQICLCKSASFKRRSCPRSQRTCLNQCAFGRALNRRGCPTCTCNPRPISSTEETCPEITATCRMQCPQGFAKDAKGCDICKCVSDGPALLPVSVVRVNACPSVGVSCRMHCPQGFARDANGCEICRCANATVSLLPASVDRGTVDCSRRPSCRKHCEHGFEKGEDGCDICRCREIPRTAIHADCVNRSCKNYCAFGYQVDSNGCRTCTCRPSRSDGPQVEHRRTEGCDDVRATCAMQCQNGFARDDKGCEVCRCA